MAITDVYFPHLALRLYRLDSTMHVQAPAVRPTNVSPLGFTSQHSHWISTGVLNTSAKSSRAPPTPSAHLQPPPASHPHLIPEPCETECTRVRCAPAGPEPQRASKREGGQVVSPPAPRQIQFQHPKAFRSTLAPAVFILA